MTSAIQKQNCMDAKSKNPVVSMLIELVVYGALVVGYFFLVLHFLGNSLLEIYERDKRIYAVVALCLIVGQGVILETLTTALLKWIRSKVE